MAEYPVYTQGTENNRNNSGDINDLSESNKKEIRAFIKRTGRAPSIEEISEITGRTFSSEQDKLKADEFIKSEFGDEITNPSAQNQYYMDPRNIVGAMRGDPSAEGTPEESLYQLALEQRQGQLQQQEQQIGQSERGMQQDMAENRQKLMDQIRSRRRSLLKSGLSSAQVANEEVQSLMQRQQQAAQIADQYYQQRQQVQTQTENAPREAGMQAYELAQGANETGAQFAASDAGDPASLALRLQRQNIQPKYWDDATNQGN